MKIYSSFLIKSVLLLIFTTGVMLTPFSLVAKETLTSLKLEQVDDETYAITLTSFDGSIAHGQLKLPKIKQKSYPVLLSLHGMGRSHHRLWSGEFKGGKTLENTHKLTQIALENGYAVIGIDARFHGGRKQKDLGLGKILGDLKQGNSDHYKNMISDTVTDYMVLIEQLKNVSFLDENNLSIAGYSMGAQMSLLIAAKNQDISRVFSIVAPAISEDIEEVSPLHQVSHIEKAKVYLFTSNKDQYSTSDDNVALFNAISTPNKIRVEFNGEHILPKLYVSVFEQLWTL